MVDRKQFTANGIVWGNCWGSGKSGFAAVKVTGDTFDEVRVIAQEKLEDGSLDSGMGFESLYAATLNVKIEDIKIIDGKEYTHTEYESLFLGNVSEKEEEFFFQSDM